MPFSPIQRNQQWIAHFSSLACNTRLDQCCRTEQRTYLQRVRKHKYRNGNLLAQKITKPSKSKDLIAIYILHLLRDTFESFYNPYLSYALVIDLNSVLFYTKSFPINKFSVNLMKQLETRVEDLLLTIWPESSVFSLTDWNGNIQNWTEVHAPY